MRRRHRGLALALCAGLLLVAAPAFAEAPQLDDHGWWWRAQTGATELPPPPFVPEGGLAVSREVDGPSAIAALRYEVGDGDITAATLTLEVASEQGGDVAAIRACPAAERWRGAAAGKWDERPEADCDAGKVNGSADEGHEVWEFDVGLLADDGVIDLVLLPAEEAEDSDQAPLPGSSSEEGAGAPFQVAFEPPQDDSLETSDGVGGDFDGGFDGGDFGDDEEASADAQQGANAERSAAGGGDDARQGSAPELSDAAPFDTSSDSGTSSGGGGEAREVPPPDVAGAEPEVDRSTGDMGPGDLEQPAPEVAGDADEAVAVAPVGFGDDRGRQVAALTSLLAAAAAAFLLMGERGTAATGIPGLRSSRIVRPEVAGQRLPAHVSGDGGERLGGLGRFVRPREGEPPSL